MTRKPHSETVHGQLLENVGFWLVEYSKCFLKMIINKATEWEKKLIWCLKSICFHNIVCFALLNRIEGERALALGVNLWILCKEKAGGNTRRSVAAWWEWKRGAGASLPSQIHWSLLLFTDGVWVQAAQSLPKCQSNLEEHSWSQADLSKIQYSSRILCVFSRHYRRPWFCYSLLLKLTQICTLTNFDNIERGEWCEVRVRRMKQWMI